MRWSVLIGAALLLSVPSVADVEPHHVQHRFARPHVDFDSYARRYSHLPDFRVHRSWGLVAPLASHPELAFLKDAALIGSYMQDARVVYLYVIDEDGAPREFRVDEFGHIL
jgi:hypothetical protein